MIICYKQMSYTVFSFIGSSKYLKIYKTFTFTQILDFLFNIRLICETSVRNQLKTYINNIELK